jgi:VWFA-related protein
MNPARLLASAVLTVLAVGGPAALAQQRVPAPPERGRPLAPVDFSVVTRDGKPVRDLKPGEVTIRIGGRQRPVQTLQHITVPAGGDIAVDPDLPLPFGTNDVAEGGRTLALIVETDSFRAGRESIVREASNDLISRLSPADRLSLVTVPYGGVKVPFTTEHARVRNALTNVIGQAEAGETGSQLACRTGRTLESLIGYLDERGIREDPLTVMLITGGLAAPRRDAPVTMAPGMCELRAEVFQEVARAAGAARAQFYIIQPGDITGAAGTIQRENIAGTGYDGSDNPIEGIEHLAGVTGGKMLALTGSAGGALGRIFDETASYYLAAVDLDASERNGRTYPLEVRVNRPGVEVRTRPQIAFLRPDRIIGPPLNPSPREMIGVMEVFRDLPLRAAAFSALDADGRTLRLVTVAEPVDPAAKLAALLAALFDRDGKLVSNWNATPEELQRTPVIGAMPAEPGAYRLRVAAIDTEGRAGTADYDLEAEIVQTGPLKVSSLILGLSREGRFLPKLQFGNEPVAIAYVELYGATPGTRLSSALEVAKTMNGPALSVAPLAIEASGENRYIAKGAIPIGALPPGDYIIRALVGIEGQALTRVVRTLRKKP